MPAEPAVRHPSVGSDIFMALQKKCSPRDAEADTPHGAQFDP
jgi:hypothetical protein